MGMEYCFSERVYCPVLVLTLISLGFWLASSYERFVTVVRHTSGNSVSTWRIILP